MPSWSSPKPISAAEQHMPLDISPRILRWAISMPLGMTVPIVANGMRSPTDMLNAPQQTCRASPSPQSTSTSWILSASGWGRRSSTFASTTPSRSAPVMRHLLDRQAERAERLPELDRVAVDVGRKLPQPRKENLHVSPPAE